VGHDEIRGAALRGDLDGPPGVERRVRERPAVNTGLVEARRVSTQLNIERAALSS
jgi:hypothetical protein